MQTDYLPFQGLKKGSVIQNVRMFSSPKINTRECYFLLTKILYILTGKGEDFTQDEATTVFIAVTKLFQSQDVRYSFSSPLFCLDSIVGAFEHTSQGLFEYIHSVHCH